MAIPTNIKEIKNFLIFSSCWESLAKSSNSSDSVFLFSFLIKFCCIPIEIYSSCHPSYCLNCGPFIYELINRLLKLFLDYKSEISMIYALGIGSVSFYL